MELKYYASKEKKIRVIGELFTGRQDTQYITGEAGLCAFAPDESLFAWSCGSRKIVILPWDTYQNCLFSEDNQKAAAHQIVSERISIDCGFLVCSLAFGVGTPIQNNTGIGRKDYWTRFDFSRDLTLATGHINGRIRVWDPYSGKLLLELTDHRFAVYSLCFAFDGSLRLASASQDGTIKVWDLADDGNMFQTLRDAKTSALRCISWSPNSKYLCAVGLNRKVVLWNMEEYYLHKRLDGHLNDVNACSFSPDGAILATASSDTRVILWNTATGEIQKILNHMIPPPGPIYMAGSNDYYVRGVSFAPNGCQVATTCCDGCLRIWDLMSEDDDPQPAVQEIPDDPLLSCVWSPSGGVIAVCFGSGSTVFYSPPPKVPSLLHFCRMAIRKSFGATPTEEHGIFIPRTLQKFLQYEEW